LQSLSQHLREGSLTFELVGCLRERLPTFAFTEAQPTQRWNGRVWMAESTAERRPPQLVPSADRKPRLGWRTACHDQRTLVAGSVMSRT
jgi:hypothetical protein